MRTPAGRFATIIAVYEEEAGRVEVLLRYEDGDTVRLCANHLRGLP